MYPVLVSLGPLHLYSFGTLAIVGVLIAWILLRYLIYFYRLQSSKFYYALPWGIVGAVLAARLGFILTYTERLRGSFLSIFFPEHWWTEWSLWAGIWGALLGFVIYWLKHNEPVFLWLDVMGIAIQPLVFFMSLGLFLSPLGLTAEALGRPTTLPWGVIVDAVDLPFANVPVHPLLLYVVVMSLLVFVLTWWMRVWARTYVGRLYVVVMALYSVLWFGLGVVRWYSPRTFWGLDVFWMNSVLYMILAIICLFYIVRKHAITKKVKEHATNL